MKSVAGSLRLNLAQYRELESFAQFGSDLDQATQQQLRRGARLVELLKQGQYSPTVVEKQVVSIFAGIHGHLDDIEVKDVQRFESEFFSYLENRHQGLLDDIRTKKILDDSLRSTLTGALKDFKENQFKKSGE